MQHTHAQAAVGQRASLSGPLAVTALYYITHTHTLMEPSGKSTQNYSVCALTSVVCEIAINPSAQNTVAKIHTLSHT